jgi:hydroxymethylglutaryl-CoA reductase (NADPH)
MLTGLFLNITTTRTTPRRPTMRAFFKPFARHAADSPIETIVFFSVIGTLAYFHVLSAIKHSAFLAPASPSALRPAHALLRDNEWVAVPEGKWQETRPGHDQSVTPFEMQQVVFSVDGVKVSWLVPG